MSEISFYSPIGYLKGVGEKRATLMQQELDIYTIEDLLTYFPYRYVDKSKYYLIKDLKANINTYIQLKGIITEKNIIGERRGKRLTAKFQDETGCITLVWFNNIKYFNEILSINKTYIVFGKPTLFNSHINITHPEINSEENNSPHSIPFQPMYNSTDKAKRSGLDSRGISKLCRSLLEIYGQHIEETLPEYIQNKLQLVNRKKALFNIHFPNSTQDIAQAIRRLKFEEIFFLQLFLMYSQHITTMKSRGYLFPKVGELFNTFYHHHLQFSLTQAQKRVIKEIRSDFVSGHQMNRLLQGDVGSGKTITALLLILLVIDNGYQCCLMAPTEILAQQHYNNICKMLGDLPINVNLLTGSTKQSERKNILNSIGNGKTNLLIGTHALIEDDVLFKQLGFVIIDEQHRFGVEQRAKLWRKSLIPPHVLIMTATPIPRTLSMTVYGNLDMSIIDELPIGRKPIQTLHFYKRDSAKINQFLKQEIANGRQIYVVFPLIEESETLSLSNLMEGYEEFKLTYPSPEYEVGIVHGKMNSEEKETVMQNFNEGKIHILLATTVIEVGIDVPNATVMVIENAERFGLSQLHQLRGRVGRGNEQSYCVLLTDYELSKEAHIRIKAMLDTNDGFEIANVDLKLRGPGDMAGTRQSGVLDFKLINILQDERIISTARDIAKSILQEDAELMLEKNWLLRKKIENMNNHSKKYYRIG